MILKFKEVLLLSACLLLSTASKIKAVEVDALPPSQALRQEGSYTGFFGKTPYNLLIDRTFENTVNNDKVALVSKKDFSNWFGEFAASGYLRLYNEYHHNADTYKEYIDKADGVILVRPNPNIQLNHIAISQDLCSILAGIDFQNPSDCKKLKFIPVKEKPNKLPSVSFNLDVKQTLADNKITISQKVLEHQIRKKFKYLPLTEFMSGRFQLSFNKNELADVQGIENIILTQKSIARCGYIDADTRMTFFTNENSDHLNIDINRYTMPQSLGFEHLIQPAIQPIRLDDVIQKRRRKKSQDDVIIKDLEDFLADNNQQDKPQITNVNLDFSALGIGGLNTQLDEIVRSILSRAVSQDVLEKLGIQGHERGILLYGPPGTGKTLIARELAKILGVKEKNFRAVGGPELLDKYVGESEKNIRSLFAGAELNPKELFIIFLDEIDSIASTRSKGGGVGDKVNNNLVNQLLTKMDGVKAPNNVLIIGATNRLDIIDPALLRPGRFGVQLHIGLPDESGRREIFDIHLRASTKNNALADDVNVIELAERTPNYTGAEIKGICDNARSFALKDAQEDPSDLSKINESKLKITAEHFKKAFDRVTPAFGQKASSQALQLPYHQYKLPSQQKIVDKIKYQLIQHLDKKSNSGSNKVYKILLHGSENSGKSAIAGILTDLISPKVDLIRIISPGNGFYDQLRQAWDDSHFVDSSLIILDGLETLTSIINSYKYDDKSMNLLNTILGTPITNKIVVIATTNAYELFSAINKSLTWNITKEVPAINKKDLKIILEQHGIVNPDCQKASENLLVSQPVGKVIEAVSTEEATDYTVADWENHLSFYFGN